MTLSHTPLLLLLTWVALELMASTFRSLPFWRVGRYVLLSGLVTGAIVQLAT